MPTSQQFKPTINEESPVGGSTSFGAEPFVPSINTTGVAGPPSGTTSYTAFLQKLGRIVFFYIVLEGVSIAFAPGTAFRPPISPSKFPVGHVFAGHPTGWGVAMDSVLGMVAQNANGGWDSPTAPVAGSYRLSGYYWVD